MAGTHGLAWLLGVVSTLCSRRVGARLLQVWARAYVKSTGVCVEISGELTLSKPALVVSNHMSSLDGMVLVAEHPFVVVARDELSRHPIVGRLLRNAGMIFVRQGSLASLRDLITSITTGLQRGDSVLAFPEGTIRCSPPGGQFSSSVMQAAIDARVPVRPVLMWCELADGRPTSRASWLGTEPLRQSLQRIQRIRGLVLKVHVLPDIEPDDVGNRGELARMARQSIVAAVLHSPVTCQANRPSDMVEVNS
ncbi:MAG: 1-acyl-sn-glycerol-3-phosphate acyltransferase [Pseudonocardiales bacterium]|nr:1-acyl-sn-glycerol-3-phosphate acyltransferase [Pseudonocardiales bacterium]